MIHANKLPLGRLSPSRRKPGRQTGFPPAVRKLIDWRDSDQGRLLPYVRCQCCGLVRAVADTDIQHRIARGMGGSRNPVISSVINGLRMCRLPCHRSAEARSQLLYDRGFWRWQSEVDDLPVIPVIRFDRRAYWPTSEGRWLAEAPAGDAA